MLLSTTSSPSKEATRSAQSTAMEKSTQTSHHSSPSEEMPFRSPTRVSFSLPHGKESPGRRQRRDSELSEPESMLSEKLKGHQQLLTSTRNPPPPPMTTLSRSPSTVGTKKRISSGGSGGETSGKPGAEIGIKGVRVWLTLTATLSLSFCISKYRSSVW